jgi:RES domain-containing protein
LAVQTLWRIAKHTRDFAADDLSGGGAAAVGGRWNGEGFPVVYASTSISLCTLETLSHMGDDIACRNRFLVVIEIPEKLWVKRKVWRSADLPLTWVAEPPGMETVKLGNAWLKNQDSLLLLVPSVIIHEEFNVLINPLHKDANQLKASVVRPFVYDPRLG